MSVEQKPDARREGTVGSEAELRAIYKQPTPVAAGKEIGIVDRYCRAFIALSPFVCIGTMSANDLADVSPRGGAPGFVEVLDDHHLALPDLPGNNRLDSFLNIVERPSIGMLFFVPGFEDMLRVNGFARITTDPALIGRLARDGKLPASVLLVEVRQTQMHCAKAVRRAGLWDPSSYVDRTTFPSLGQILNDQLALARNVTEFDANLEKYNRETLY